MKKMDFLNKLYSLIEWMYLGQSLLHSWNIKQSAIERSFAKWIHFMQAHRHVIVADTRMKKQ